MKEHKHKRLKMLQKMEKRISEVKKFTVWFTILKSLILIDFEILFSNLINAD